MRFGALTIFLDRNDLVDVQAAQPAALEGELLVLEPDLSIELRAARVPHRTTWDFVDARDFAAARRLERSAWAFWRRHAEVRFERWNLLQLAAFRHVAALSRLTFAAFVIRRALEKLRSIELVTFDEPAGHGLDRPPEDRRMPLLWAVARGIAEHARVPVRLIPRKRPVDVEDDAAPCGCADAQRAAPACWKPTRPFVLFHANGIDVRRQWPLIAELSGRDDLEAVQVYKSTDADSLREARSLGHVVLSEAELLPDVPAPDISAACQQGWRAFQTACAHAPEALRGVFDNAHVRPHFEFLFGDYAVRVAQQVARWAALLQQTPPAVMVANYHAPAVDVATSLKVETLGLPHGLLVGNTDWTRTLGTRSIGVLSARHRELLLEGGVGADRIVELGDPWLQKVDASRGGAAATGRDPAALRSRLEAVEGTRLVVLCTSNLGIFSKAVCLPLTNWKQGLDDFEAIWALAAKHPQWRFALRSHPRFDHAALYESLNARLPAPLRVRICNDVSLEQLAGAADVIVSPNVISSAIVEASFYGRPVLVLSGALCWYEPSDWRLAGWPHVANVAALEMELQRLFAHPEHYDRRAGQTRAALREYLGSAAASGAARCARWITERLSLPASGKREDCAVQACANAHR